MASKSLAFGLVATLMVLILLLAEKPALAADLSVYSTADVRADDGTCTLREAITVVRRS